MSRYIDSDALMMNTHLIVRVVDDSNGMPHQQYETVIFADDIDDAPTVDAVEVVRCKDCRFNPKVSFVGCPMSGLDKRKDWDFCSYGDEVTENG